MNTPSLINRSGGAALLLAALPSGPAGAEGSSPYLWLAHSTAPSVAQAQAGELVLDATDVSRGMVLEHDGPIRIYGDIVGTGPYIELRSPDIEVFGSVTGDNIRLWTQPTGDIDLSDVASHTGRLKIHGDVNVLNSRLGGAGTGELDILGHVSLSGYRNPGDNFMSSTLIGRDVCIAGNLNAVGTPFTVMVGADELRVGRDVTGQDVSINIYSVTPVINHVQAEGTLPAFPGSALIGGDVRGQDISIGNGEVSIDGVIVGEDIQIFGQRAPLPVMPEDLSCEDPIVLSQAVPATHRPGPG